ncbi:hypothetical protein ACIQWB_35625 [Streptomyces olivaceus]|uniref:hypothetical protein n=1 Tax=Streptomyces olivaceus TaxID=47716 RepID=UPI0037F7F3AE
MSDDCATPRGHPAAPTPVLPPLLRAEDEAAVVLADGFSCRTRIHEFDSGGHEEVHVAELPASALPSAADTDGTGTPKPRAARVRHRTGRPAAAGGGGGGWHGAHPSGGFAWTGGAGDRRLEAACRCRPRRRAEVPYRGDTQRGLPT